MYDIRPNLILGFHGCDRMVRDTLLLNPDQFKISQKPYDWLGHGLYFWENNYDRALQWAIDKKARGEGTISNIRKTVAAKQGFDIRSSQEQIIALSGLCSN